MRKNRSTENGSSRIPLKVVLKWTLLGVLAVVLTFLIGYISFVIRL